MGKPILKGTDLGYYASDKTILQHLDFEIAPQEFVTLTGPSGGGKSTLLRLLAALISKTSGSLTFKAEEIETYEPTAYRRQVSYAFQQPQLFGQTVADNLEFPFTIRNEPFDNEKAVEFLGKVNLEPDSLNQPITELSGGERQRVALLRNILFMPEVLLLDEITTGLDVDNKAIINRLIGQLNQTEGLTIISITHDTSEFKLANRLLTLKDGQLEA